MRIPPTEELLAHVEAMAGGDVDALVALQEAAGPWVHAAIVAIVGGPNEASAALLTDVFAAMWQQAQHYDRHLGPPLLWALLLARSAALAHKTHVGTGIATRDDHPITTLPADGRDALLAAWRDDTGGEAAAAALVALVEAGDR